MTYKPLIKIIEKLGIRISKNENIINNSKDQNKAPLDKLRRLSKSVKELELVSADVNSKVAAVSKKLHQNSTYISEEKIFNQVPSCTPIHQQFLADQKTKILVADDFHINPRNFASLYEKMKHLSVIKTVGVSLEHPYFLLIKACGNYKGHEKYLQFYKEKLASLTFEELLKLKYRNVPVVEISIDEALSFVIANDSWQLQAVEKKIEVIFQKLWDEDREILLLNCAATMLWTDYWADFPDLNKFEVAVIFSGSYIYGRTLLYLLQYTKVKGFVVESFTTGNDYFFEERYTPIANNSRVRHKEYRARYAHIKAIDDNWEREKIRSFNKLRALQNKNVKQPLPMPLPRSIATKRTMLVLGQVVNDFSVISGCGSILCTIPTYKEIIGRLLSDSDTLVIFKAHPWEKKKQNIQFALTESKMHAWAKTLPEAQQNRLMIVSDWNLQQLFKVTDFVFTLCSQSALEAALEGFRPMVIGGSFFDSAGFTANFATALDAAEAALHSDASGKMTLDEFSAFEDYLATLLQCHLINVSGSGVGKLTALFRSYHPQNHVKSYISERAVSPTFEKLGA